MKKWFHSNYIHFLITGIFIALCLAYFSPAMQGKVLYQSDVMEAKAMSKEIMDVKAKTGEGPLWTNSMFGGMPSFQIWAKYPGNITTYVISFLKTVFPDPVDIILCFLLGSYFLLSVLRMKPWLAAAGAIAFAFSSYNFIYILAGHANHAMAMAVFAPILGSILLTFERWKASAARRYTYRIFPRIGNPDEPHPNDVLFVHHSHDLYPYRAVSCGIRQTKQTFL